MVEPSARGLIDGARQTSGLEAFDDDSFREGLDRVAFYGARNAALTETGRESLKGVCLQFLVNRLRISDCAARHPEIRARRIEAPIAILGLPRTGTTLVSHLMSLDPARRSLLRWEVFDSAPPAAAGALTSDPRCLRMKAADESALNTPPEIHLEQADLPIECIVSLAHDFKGMLWHGMLDDAGFGRWTRDAAIDSAYGFHTLQLQLLQTNTTNRWVLKAPAHGLHIAELRRAYPDVRVIWTHRDPYRAMGSICSITAASRRVFGAVDEVALGPSLIETFAEHIRRPMILDEEGGQMFHHLHYADLMRDPLHEIERIYAWLGEPFTPTFSAAVQGWLTANPRGRFGSHDYGLARFGLSVERLRPHFEDYVRAYDVEPEGAA